MKWIFTPHTRFGNKRNTRIKPYSLITGSIFIYLCTRKWAKCHCFAFESLVDQSCISVFLFSQWLQNSPTFSIFLFFSYEWNYWQWLRENEETFLMKRFDFRLESKVSEVAMRSCYSLGQRASVHAIFLPLQLHRCIDARRWEYYDGLG